MPANAETLINGESKASSSSDGPKELSLINWNIDGLDKDELRLNVRFLEIYEILNRLKPDVIFLQEVVTGAINSIEKLKDDYQIYYSDNQSGYYTAILVLQAFEFENHRVYPFENTRMDRTLQVLEGKLRNLKVFLMTTHLESLAEFSDKRKAQMLCCLTRMDEIIKANPEALVIFGGDLNIREKEIPNLPSGVRDAFIAAGSPEDHQFTWDPRINHNRQTLDFGCRFDRIYWSGPLSKVSFKLEGRDLIKPTQYYPSDHWAIHCIFSSS